MRATRLKHPFNTDLKMVLDADKGYDYLPEGTWLAGGCGLLAQSLRELIPESSLSVVGRLNRGIPDHLVVCVPVSGQVVYLDYNGVQTEGELLAAMQEECMGEPVQVRSLAHVQAVGFPVDELLWAQSDVQGFCRYLQRELGPVTADRCDPARAGDAEPIDLCEEQDTDHPFFAPTSG